MAPADRCSAAFCDTGDLAGILGSRVAATLAAELAFDALEMASGDEESTRAGSSLRSGGQYLAIRYPDRLAAEEAVSSVGSMGTTASTTPWPSRSSASTSPSSSPSPVRGARSRTSSWPPGLVDWFNHRRLMWPVGAVPSAEFEATWLQVRENEALRAPGSPANDGRSFNTPAQPSFFDALETQ